MANTRGPSMLVVLILIGFSWTENFVNPSDTAVKLDLISEIKANVVRAMGPDSNNTLTDEKSRLRRNILLSTNNLNSQNTAEGLLSTCQLTNLLLYQLINQKFGPAGNILNSPLQPQILPFQGLGTGVLLGQNSFNAPILQTFLHTSTVLSETMTLSIATVTLMFGNQKSTAVITNTKAYNITSTQVVTLTSTIQPTSTIPAEIALSATRPPNEVNSNLDYDDDYGGGRFGKGRRQTNFMSTPVLEASAKPRGTSKRRKFRTKQEAEAEFARERLNAEQVVTAVPENKYSHQKDRQNVLSRRPKRLDNYDTLSSELEYENSDSPLLERDHLLEPSYDGVSRDGEAAENNPCPKPSEITVTYTKTVTKFVNSPSSIKFNTGDFRIDDVPNNPVVNQIKSAPAVPENFNNKERRSFRPKPRYESPTEGVLESINEEQYPSRRFQNSATEAPPTTRSSNRFGNLRANFRPGTSNTAAKATSLSSSKFVRSRGKSTITSTPKPEISGNEQISTSNRRRSSSRLRGFSTTTERSNIDYTPRSSSRFKNKTSRNSGYASVETTTRSSSRFKNKNRSSRIEKPPDVPADQVEETVDSKLAVVEYETVDSEPAVVEYETYARKYNKLRNRFSPTS